MAANRRGKWLKTAPFCLAGLSDNFSWSNGRIEKSMSSPFALRTNGCFFTNGVFTHFCTFPLGYFLPNKPSLGTCDKKGVFQPEKSTFFRSFWDFFQPRFFKLISAWNDPKCITNIFPHSFRRIGNIVVWPFVKSTPSPHPGFSLGGFPNSYLKHIKGLTGQLGNASEPVGSCTVDLTPKRPGPLPPLSGPSPSIHWSFIHNSPRNIYQCSDLNSNRGIDLNKNDSDMNLFFLHKTASHKTTTKI